MTETKSLNVQLTGVKLTDNNLINFFLPSIGSTTNTSLDKLIKEINNEGNLFKKFFYDNNEETENKVPGLGTTKIIAQEQTAGAKKTEEVQEQSVLAKEEKTTKDNTINNLIINNDEINIHNCCDKSKSKIKVKSKKAKKYRKTKKYITISKKKIKNLK